MIRTTTFAALLLAGVSFPALATRQEPPRQTGGATTATAGAQAFSVAGAAAINRTSVRTSATGGRATSSATGGDAASSQTVTMTMGSERSRNGPDVNAPAIWSNNPCLVGLSGGVSIVGFGASIGAGIEDRDCTRRANAQHLAAMGEREAAREVLCGSREVREAFARIGRPCAADAVSVTPTRIEAPAPVNTSGLSDDACRTLRARGMDVRGCP